MSKNNRIHAWDRLRDTPDLKPGARFALITIADLVDDGMMLTSGVDYLSTKRSGSPSSWRRWIRELMAYGFLVPTVTTAGGYGQHNEYRLDLDFQTVRARRQRTLPEWEREKAAELVRRKSGRGALDAISLDNPPTPVSSTHRRWSELPTDIHAKPQQNPPTPVGNLTESKPRAEPKDFSDDKVGPGEVENGLGGIALETENEPDGFAVAIANLRAGGIEFQEVTYLETSRKCHVALDGVPVCGDMAAGAVLVEVRSKPLCMFCEEAMR